MHWKHTLIYYQKKKWWAFSDFKLYTCIRLTKISSTIQHAICSHTALLGESVCCGKSTQQSPEVTPRGSSYKHHCSTVQLFASSPCASIQLYGNKSQRSPRRTGTNFLNHAECCKSDKWESRWQSSTKSLLAVSWWSAASSHLAQRGTSQVYTSGTGLLRFVSGNNFYSTTGFLKCIQLSKIDLKYLCCSKIALTWDIHDHQPGLGVPSWHGRHFGH